MILLETLLTRLQHSGLLIGRQGPVVGVQVDHLANDSRKVGPGGLFVAIRGGKTDGHLFIDKAVTNGAIAIVYEAMPEEALARFPGIALVHVSNARQTTSELAAAFFGDPSSRLRMVGITGTNGKTTTAFLVRHLLTRFGEKTGLIGTIELSLGAEPVAANLTTPDPLELHGLFGKMLEAGCSSCVMEVSSHALDQDRVRGVEFQTAVFTNLTRDHQDYHASMEAYFLAKKRLFDGLRPEDVAIFNGDDPAGTAIVADTAARRVAFGRSEKSDIPMEVLENTLAGLRLRIDGHERRHRLVGLFNAYNLSAAYAVGRELGYPPSRVADALAEAEPVPGRFEQFRFADGTTVVVDYAHTPDALENVLLTIMDTKPPTSALWCVFGCGGDRDTSKRRFMGSIAERYADRVVVTSDNPRTEDPEAIMNDIRRGMNEPSRAQWIVNRRDAICWTAERARPGDVVLVAGKGHETYQIVGTKRTQFDDREEVVKCFESRVR
jgi:UDP-N-acetylmuramoyl-L-alanyl-D-glutamate--2,6-diaminopimelate ligase